MLKNRYSLIARDIDTNRFKVIDVGNTLEEIDLFTIDYFDSRELSKKLYEDNIIDFSNADLFIVCRRSGKNNKNISYQEVLYSDSDCIRDVAKNSLNNKMANSFSEIDNIYERFDDFVVNNGDFYKYAIHGKLNLYPKFTKYYIGISCNRYSDIKNKDGGWVRKSYYLIRNVLETISRYTNHKYPVLNDYKYRDLLYSDLLEVTQKDYNTNQINMFDKINTLDDTNQKMFTVLETIDNISLNTFKMVDGEVKINEEKFPQDINVDRLLSNYLKSKIRDYIINKDFLICDIDSSDTTSKYYTAVKNNLEDIISLLKSHKVLLDNAYNFCLLYNDIEKGNLYGYQKTKGMQGIK